ncbi:MAG: hypothetical protein ACT4OT_00750 [Acidobacteriota bacterium]
MEVADKSLQPGEVVLTQPANLAAGTIDLKDLFVWSCRAIAGVGGGFAFGWSVAGNLGALICSALGLIAFALGEKYHR